MYQEKEEGRRKPEAKYRGTGGKVQVADLDAEEESRNGGRVQGRRHNLHAGQSLEIVARSKSATESKSEGAISHYGRV
jgi:hypothetical protein